jgi:cold shock CspA family protein
MARPQETFNKKELEKRRIQKKKEKEQRKEERKSQTKEGQSWETMIAYVDENGNISNTPPDPTRKRDVKTEDIVTGSRNTGSQEPVIRTGKVAFFNTSKGFGFIKDNTTGENLFVHMSSLLVPVKENDKVTFDVERGPKGFSAVRVKKI